MFMQVPLVSVWFRATNKQLRTCFSWHDECCYVICQGPQRSDARLWSSIEEARYSTGGNRLHAFDIEGQVTCSWQRTIWSGVDPKLKRMCNWPGLSLPNLFDKKHAAPINCICGFAIDRASTQLGLFYGLSCWDRNKSRVKQTLCIVHVPCTRTTEAAT